MNKTVIRDCTIYEGDCREMFSMIEPADLVVRHADDADKMD
jgi:hypothetical protein